MTTAEQIQLANEYRSQVERLVSGEYPDDTRKLLLIAYTDLVLEHHQSIMALLHQQYFGSAFSLVRVLFEAFFRAHWVTGCATVSDVEKLSQKEFDFPGMGTMVEDIDRAFDTATFFTDIKKQAWTAMNSYTHSGLRQLTRRFDGGRIQANYSDQEITEVIDSITMSVLLLARLFCVIMEKHEAAEEASRLIDQFGDS